MAESAQRADATGEDQVSAVCTWLMEPGREADFEERAHGIQRAAVAFRDHPEEPHVLLIHPVVRGRLALARRLARRGPCLPPPLQPCPSKPGP
ncbi:hypothetical protein ACFQ0X_43085 [Streptomyces rectiviolaceus]|uniref:hypothetical protein n=1 Tax=Streptomyces rectiviolaceus TaxID=332591 RepID=UPI0031D81D98